MVYFLQLSFDLLCHCFHATHGIISSSAHTQEILTNTEWQASSRGRGPRVAGWFDDYIRGQPDEKMKSLVMVEGIKGWARAGGEYVGLMDEYDEGTWRKES